MSNRYLVIIIFILALLLRVGFIVTYDGQKFLKQELVASDAVGYKATALNILKGNGVVVNEDLKGRLGPIYPGFMAIVFMLFGQNIVILRFLQAFIGALTCVVIYLAANEMFGDKCALLSMLLCAIYYAFIQMPAYVVAEVLYAFFIAITVWQAFVLIKKPSVFRACLTGFLYGITVLTKGALVGFVIFFAISLVIAMKTSIHKRFFFAGLFVFVLVLTISPWVLRNYRIYNSLVPVTVHAGELLYKGNCPSATGGSGGMHTRGVDFVDPQLTAGLDEYDRDRIQKEMALRYMKENPVRCINLAFIKLWNMWRPYHASSSIVSKMVMIVFYIPLMFFSLAGIVMSLSRWREFMIFYLLMAYYTVIHMILIGVIRYRYPVEQFLVIFCSYFLICMYDLFRKNRGKMFDAR